MYTSTNPTYDLDYLLKLLQVIEQKIGFLWRFSFAFDTPLYNQSNIEELLGESFNEIQDSVDHLDQIKLSIDYKFTQSHESKIWDGYANYLVHTSKDTFGDLYGAIRQHRDKLTSECFKRFDWNDIHNNRKKLQLLTVEDQVLFNNTITLQKLMYIIRDWATVIKECLEVFMPNIYEANKKALNIKIPRFIKGRYVNPFEDDNAKEVNSTIMDNTEKGIDKDADMNVKILIAYQSGLLKGEFHKLPQEKQYAVLAVLLNKSMGNVKNAITALTGNSNSNKNPLSMPSVVEKANELIEKKGLNIGFIKSRKE